MMKFSLLREFTFKGFFNWLCSDDYDEDSYPYLSSGGNLYFNNCPLSENPSQVVAMFPDIAFIDTEDDNTLKLQEEVVVLLNKLLARYEDEYMASITLPYNPWSREIDESEASSKMVKEFNKFWMKFTSFIDMTYPKYKKMLSLYSATENKLLDKLQTITESDAEAHGTNRYNDSPQEVIESDSSTYNTDQYATEIRQDDSTSGSDTTTSYDEGTLMRRLDEINTKYENLYKRWIYEFDKFFWRKEL